jgi:hypothetical protein
MRDHELLISDVLHTLDELRYGDAIVYRDLITLAQNPKNHLPTRTYALCVLGRLAAKDSHVIPYLFGLAKDKDPRIRDTVYYALGLVIGDQRYEEVNKRYVRTNQQKVRIRNQKS